MADFRGSKKAELLCVEVYLYIDFSIFNNIGHQLYYV